MMTPHVCYANNVEDSAKEKTSSNLNEVKQKNINLRIIGQPQKKRTCNYFSTDGTVIVLSWRYTVQ